MGITTVNELITKTVKEIKEIRNLGDKSYEEVVQKVIGLGYSFKKGK